MGLAPWGALGSGKFKTEEQLKDQEGRQMGGASEADQAVSKVLEKIANEKNTIITSVALAYVMHKTPHVFPVCTSISPAHSIRHQLIIAKIVGGRKIEHLKGNIEALSIRLSPEEIQEIEDVTPFDVGFPMNMLFMGQKYNTNLGASDLFLTKLVTHLDTVDKAKAITPREKAGP